MNRHLSSGICVLTIALASLLAPAPSFGQASKNPFDDLKNADANVRIGAAKRLADAKLSEKDILRAFDVIETEKELKVRVAIVDAVAHSIDKSTALKRALLKIMDDPQYRHNESPRRVLARCSLADGEILAALMKQVRYGETEAEERPGLNTIAILRDQGPKAAPAVPALINKFKELGQPISKTRSPLPKLAILDALGYIGTAHSATLPFLTFVLLDDKEGETLNLRALGSLYRIGKEAGPAFPDVKKFLQKRGRGMVSYATALDSIQPPETKPFMLACLKSRENPREARQIALRYFARLGENATECIPILLAIMHDDQEVFSGVNFIDHFSAMRKSGVPELIKLLTTGNARAKSGACVILESIKAYEAMPVIEALLNNKDEDKFVRGAAHNAVITLREMKKIEKKKCNRSPVFDFHEIRDYKEGRKAGICQPIFSCLPAFLIKLSFL